MATGPLGNAFTDTDIRYTFEILETPYASQYSTLDGLGFIGATTAVYSNSTGQAMTEIIDAMTTLDATSVTMCQSLIQNWIQVRLNSAQVQDGGVGENAVTGVRYDPERDRKLIKDRFTTYLPFWKYHEVLARRAGGAQVTLSIPTSW